ncbi:hypothetical protein RQM47_00565 [Rubrivirga sp. S365]|uniref:Uncharacterized protein n=1 Tax=Rubrivirga litoralis TaxID=3075598 RepID=A0ABU3BVC3_9BACT|nr:MULTISPECIES: hypothetical protein [unclassified Rubrivirga]MDT0633232.1 hypothetical protein [Rubrivirga sp. F394]MDT7855128.1 hypothetical protein [Rubrivirga sp. S365]
MRLSNLPPPSLLGAALLLAFAAPAAAQDAATPGAGGAEAVVGEYVRAFTGGDYVAAARLLDPDELEEFMGLMGALSELDETGAFDVDPDATPPEAFAEFLSALTGAEPLVGEAIESARGRVVGSVAEGDSLRHVVVRTQAEVMGTDIDGVELTTAQWTGDRWVVTFDAKMQQFKAGLEAALAAQGGAEDDG